jgi:hypothetical protein
MREIQSMVQEASKLCEEERLKIIQSLWKKVTSDVLILVSDRVAWIIKYSQENPEYIPEIRYELETYRNNLNPWFSDEFISKNEKQSQRILDIGAGPGDVSIRWWTQLAESWCEPVMIALEWSARFIWDILENSQRAWVPSRELDASNLSYIDRLTPGIYPVRWNALDLWNIVPGVFDLVVANYVLDRIPQRKFLQWVIKLLPQRIQFTNCIPLQYQNPNTWQSYIDPDEIIIPAGATDLNVLGKQMELIDIEEFFGTNTVESLQDWPENFKYAGIRWKLLK